MPRKRRSKKGTQGTDGGSPEPAQPRLAANGRPVGPTGRFVFCPGSSVAHPQLLVEVQQGPRTLHYACPVRKCGVRAYLRGPAWLDYGFTREEALTKAPNAMFLET